MNPEMMKKKIRNEKYENKIKEIREKVN